MFDLVIRGGKVVTPQSVVDADIAINDGQIVAISRSGLLNSNKVIRAEGKIVVPGGIDPHVHMHPSSFGKSSREDVTSSSMAAACGGTTTVIDFARQKIRELPSAAVQEFLREADGNSWIDFSLHCILVDATDETLRSIQNVISDGVPSFKLFMTYREDGRYLDDGQLYFIFQEIARNKGIADVHAENDAIITQTLSKLSREGKRSLRYHGESRPDISEAEAISRSIQLAQSAGTTLYIHHLSTALGLSAVEQAIRRSQPVFAEACLHHLIFSNSVYEGNNAKFVMTPPIRRFEDREELWKGLRNNVISTIGSDHAPWDLSSKAEPDTGLGLGPFGIAGVECRLPLVYSEGVGRQRLSLNEFVALTSSNAARIFGLFPRKGCIQVGSDADLTLIDPKIEVTLSARSLHSKVDYSVYEGMKVKGFPITTISRGQVLVEDRMFVGDSKHGSFIPGTIS